MTKTIILIDDDADTRTYMGTILLRGGYKIMTAGNGQEGWQMIQENRPDLILLDMMMPRKSGMNLLADLKTNPALKDIPVIIISGVGQMTGVDMKKHMSERPGEEAIRPDNFMEKPVKPDKLLKAVKAALGG
ncbi:MAG: response regulator [Pseudomonadota bacterium]